jgi:hypothetical protein
VSRLTNNAPGAFPGAKKCHTLKILQIVNLIPFYFLYRYKISNLVTMYRRSDRSRSSRPEAVRYGDAVDRSVELGRVAPVLLDPSEFDADRM